VRNGFCPISSPEKVGPLSSPVIPEPKYYFKVNASRLWTRFRDRTERYFRWLRQAIARPVMQVRNRRRQAAGGLLRKDRRALSILLQATSEKTGGPADGADGSSKPWGASFRSKDQLAGSSRP